MKVIATRASRAAVDPSIMFTRAQFDEIVASNIIEEAALRETAGALRLTAEDRADIAKMVAYRICAEAPPAGNA